MIIYCLVGPDRELVVADTKYKRLLNFANCDGWNTSDYYIVAFDPTTGGYETTIIEPFKNKEVN